MDYLRAKRYLDTLPDWERGRGVEGPLEDYLPRMRALLRRLGDPQQTFRSIIVGGTNGKGTVSSLLAALLESSEHRTGLYTSPHLHTQRERIQVGGHLLDRDCWAAGLTELYDRTRGFADEGLGPFSRFEALTGLAALLFASEHAEFGVFEVGLGGRYDATNAWGGEVAVLTSISLDHTEVLGDDLLGIAADKLCISRSQRPLFTTGDQTPEVLDHIRRHCAGQAIPLSVCVAESEAEPDSETGATISSYPWAPALDPARPRTFVENARLAIAVAVHLAGEELTASRAQRTTEAHVWPGRFERAGQEPLVLLDGAHNPAAAAGLAEDLRGLGTDWTVVIGATHGHDADGVVGALAPVAERFIFTSFDHPRAVAADALCRAAPVAVASQAAPSMEGALSGALERAGPEGRVCVTGSLHLVARAREYFGLPFERKGIGEDVALESLQCLELACQRLGIPWERVSADGNLVRVCAPRRPVFFMRNKHPFNDYAAARVAEDKGYQQELFEGAGLPVPQALQVFNPFADDRFDRYRTHGSVEEAAADIEAHLEFPVLIKKYRSSGSQGVHLVHGREQARDRLQSIFENSSFLDNLVLVQAFVAGPEYRIVATQGELLVAYEKQSDATDEGAPGDLNPLHHASGRAVRVEGGELLTSMRDLTSRVAEVVDLGFYAIDLIHGAEGFQILELNPNPFCYYYNHSNGRTEFIGVYERLLEKYLT